MQRRCGGQPALDCTVNRVHAPVRCYVSLQGVAHLATRTGVTHGKSDADHGHAAGDP